MEAAKSCMDAVPEASVTPKHLCSRSTQFSRPTVRDRFARHKTLRFSGKTRLFGALMTKNHPHDSPKSQCSVAEVPIKTVTDCCSGESGMRQTLKAVVLAALL